MSISTEPESATRNLLIYYSLLRFIVIYSSFCWNDIYNFASTKFVVKHVYKTK